MTTVDKIFILCLIVLLTVWVAWPRRTRIPDIHAGDVLRMTEPEGLHITNGGTGKTKPHVPVECAAINEKSGVCNPTETAPQRYLRLQNEWRAANNAAREEQTPLKQKADDLFRQYMEAEHALTKEAQQ